MREIKAPQPYRLGSQASLFLAGSIEMGKAVDWQKAACDSLRDLDITILNPRRETWDPAWIQRMSNPEFKKQVDWELTALTRADVILFYFTPETQSPITLLELGLFKDKNIFVCCPDGFWRKGNIEIVCKRFRIPFFQELDSMLKRVRRELLKKMPPR